MVAGGSEDQPEAVAGQLGPVQSVIAADGGYRLLQRLSLSCQLLVGDFDTLTPQEVREAEAQGVLVEKHRPDKDQSDLELALSHAVRLGATHVTLVGALGGAWDHCLVNLLAPLSYLAAHGIWARLLTADTQLYLCCSDVVVNAPGQRVTLQALSPRVEELTLEGFEYGLSGAVLHRHQTLGLANRAVADSARISFSSGELFLAVLTSLSGEDPH